MSTTYSPSTTEPSKTVVAFMPLVYGVVLLLAEFARLGGWAFGSMLIDSACLIVLLIHAAFTTNTSLRGILIALGLIALLRIASLTLPLNQFPVLWRSAVIGVPIFAAVVIAVNQLGIEWGALGLNFRPLLPQILIGALGIPLGLVLYIVLQPVSLIASDSVANVLLSGLILLVFTGFLDAFIFAGLLRRTASALYGKWGILFAALIFTMLHLGIGSLALLPVIFIASVILFTLTDRTGSFVGAALAQGIANVLLYIVLPLIHLN